MGGMTTSAPWQYLAGAIFMNTIVYGLILLAAIACGWFDLPYGSATLLIVGFAFLALMGPLVLSFHGQGYLVLIPAHLLHQAATVLLYAWHYLRGGLAPGKGPPADYIDALYFSVSMWTTLGSNDFTVPRGMLLATALEALTAVLFLPVFAALLWDMLQAMAPPRGESSIELMEKRRAREEWQKQSMHDVD